jgi:hypothetical protein
MTQKINRWAVLFFLPIALLGACGDKGDDRDALRKDELDRDLNMALQKDTPTATFQDTAIGAQPAPEATPPPVAVTPAPRPTPAPRRPAPRPTPRPDPPRRAEAEEPVDRPAPARATTASISAGTTFAVSLNETISTDQNQTGDSFSATVRDPIIGSDGTVLIPSGALVRGRVTGVKKSGRVGETGVISLAFESVSFGGRSYPLQATVIEADPQRKNRQSTGEQAAKVAAGAAAGAIIGRIIGKNTKGTVAGAAAGAAAGTAIAMGTADVDVVLAAGSRVVLRTDAPVEVRTTSE